MTVTSATGVMLYVNGKRFSCECGAGVFAQVEHPDHPLVYACNGCGNEYAGTPTNGSEGTSA